MKRSTVSLPRVYYLRELPCSDTIAYQCRVFGDPDNPSIRPDWVRINSAYGPVMIDDESFLAGTLIKYKITSDAHRREQVAKAANTFREKSRNQVSEN